MLCRRNESTILSFLKVPSSRYPLGMLFTGKLDCSDSDGQPRDDGGPSSPAKLASALPASVDRPKLSNFMLLPGLQRHVSLQCNKNFNIFINKYLNGGIIAIQWHI